MSWNRLTGAATLAAASTLLSFATAFAGPFTDPGIAAAAPIAWADSVLAFARGPQNIANPGGPLASVGVPANALGVVNSSLVSLGDGGSITLGFSTVISNGAGADFAVFENSFLSGASIFAELGYVDVSSDGIHFARFASESLTAAPVASFGAIDASNVRNLAGKHVSGQGTGFDLSELALDPLVVGGLLDLASIRYVRVTDVIGNGSTLDSLGRPIYDPYPTAFASSGFDLAAVGALHLVPEPGTLVLLTAGLLGLGAHGRRRAGS